MHRLTHTQLSCCSFVIFCNFPIFYDKTFQTGFNDNSNSTYSGDPKRSSDSNHLPVSTFKSNITKCVFLHGTTLLFNSDKTSRPNHFWWFKFFLCWRATDESQSPKLHTREKVKTVQSKIVASYESQLATQNRRSPSTIESKDEYDRESDTWQFPRTNS